MTNTIWSEEGLCLFSHPIRQRVVQCEVNLLWVKYSISIIITAEDFLKERFLVFSFQSCGVFPALCKKCCVSLLSLEQPEIGTKGWTWRKWSAMLVMPELSTSPREHIWATCWQGRVKRKHIFARKFLTLTCNTITCSITAAVTENRDSARSQQETHNLCYSGTV